MQYVCFDFLYNFCLKYFSFLGERTEMLYEMCIGFRVKYRLLSPDFIETRILSTYFRKIISNIKIRAVRNEFPHEDGQTDRYNEANGRFSQSCGRT